MNGIEAMTDPVHPQQQEAPTEKAERPSTTIRARIFMFIDAHQGCLTSAITRHVGRDVHEYLDAMDRLGLIVRITKADKYSCADAREKRHYTADQHIGHIGRYGLGR